MSKPRPSSFGDVDDLSFWMRRVFHNTYTRQGRRVAVRGWCVKIQHHGKRRTFTLASQTRRAAAAEARALYNMLLAEGWEETAKAFGPGKPHSFPRTDIRHWQERLVYRNPPWPAAGAVREFSVRIQHAGAGWYFPLEAAEPEAAAKHALLIYRAILEEGWDRTKKTFRRETTLAFQWAQDPLLWTYTTLHTAVSERLPAPPLDAVTFGRKVRIIEDDPGIRASLEQCLGYQHKGGITAHARERLDPTCFYLINRELGAKAGVETPGSLGLLPDGIPAITYGVHADSEELFALTPGGHSVYVLKRVAPHQILVPLQGLLQSRGPTLDTLSRAVRVYFQKLLEEAPQKDAFSAAATQLTRREQEVLDLLSKGSGDKEIAQSLGISSWTVHEHVKKIFEKLQVHSRTEAVLAYLQK